jgi:16S rRNA (guanine527-N7)-methyltransferase
MLLDSSLKKMKIVQTIVDKLQLSTVHIICSRAEDYHMKFDFILGRAVASIPNFLRYSSHFFDDKNMNIKRSKQKDNINVHMIESGLIYIKGGTFQNELLEGNIDVNNTMIFPINQLVPSLINSDKSILFIPSKQIIKLHNRMKHFNIK